MSRSQWGTKFCFVTNTACTFTIPTSDFHVIASQLSSDRLWRWSVPVLPIPARTFIKWCTGFFACQCVSMRCYQI